MAFPTSTSLLLVATVFCLGVNAAEVKLPLSTAVDRQSKQVYVIAPPLLNYYNPYAAQILIPSTPQGESDPKVTAEEDDLELTGRQSSETITITPVAAECLKGEVADKGFGGCTKGSQAPSGTIVVKFSADKQVVVVALVPNPNRYSKVKLTCSDVTTTNIYTKSAKIAATTDSPVTEMKQTQVVIVSTAATSKATCSWEALA